MVDNWEAVAGGAVAICGVISFFLAGVRYLKRIWEENALQTQLLREVSAKLTYHIEVTHRDQDRRLFILERRRRA